MPPPLDPARIAEAFPHLTGIRHLATGGMKHAYYAEGRTEPVALKVVDEPVVSASDDADIDLASLSLPRRVQLEVSVMAAIDHPNLVDLLDGPSVAEIGGSQRVWWLEPFYPSSLVDRLARPWGRSELLDLGIGLLGGVERLAEAGIVHRDIKPPNIMFTRDDRPVLIDMGIAYQSEGTSITGTGERPLRTRGFMAPEQVRPRSVSPIDSRCDLFLVGINLYVAATLQNPFPPSHAEYEKRLASGQFDSAQLDASAADPCMVNVIERLLSPHPSGRYRSPLLALKAWEACI